MRPDSPVLPALHKQPVRWLTIATTFAYYRIAYRVRGWGSIPVQTGPALVIANHQHEIESVVVVTAVTFRQRAWRAPVFTASSRRMWEPGFLAGRLPWLAFALGGKNFGSLFEAIGMQPIENELHARPLGSLAYALHAAHGDLPLTELFREAAIARFPIGVVTLSDVLAPRNARAANAYATLSELREPYRGELLAATRSQLDADMAHFEQLVADGATLFLAPEGFYSGDGKLQRLRGMLPRLAPRARVFLVGISYDPFVGRRLSLTYRLVEADAARPLEPQLLASRPVTTSALLGSWLQGRSEPFTFADALAAVRGELETLPTRLFVVPELRADPARSVRAGLSGLVRLGTLRADGERYAITGQRSHPHFSRTADILVYQANFHAETLAGARALASIAS